VDVDELRSAVDQIGSKCTVGPRSWPETFTSFIWILSLLRVIVVRWGLVSSCKRAKAISSF